MITIDNIETISELTIDQLCIELDRIVTLDSKNMQNLYLIAVLSNNITERIKHYAKH
jgi:hypothetical protein